MHHHPLPSPRPFPPGAQGPRRSVAARSRPLLTLTIATSALILMIGSDAAAQTDAAPAPPAVATAAFKDPDNAALLYFKTWLQKDYIELKKPCSDNLQSGVPLWRPDPAFANLLKDHQATIEQLLRATRRPQVDWGLEYSQGIGLLLSHPGELRATARIIASDARRCLAEGDMEGACERTAALHRIARHCTTDRVLITSLVGIAINGLAHNEMRAILNTGRISATGREAILAEARTLSTPDGFGIKRGIQGEHWWTSGWLRGFAKGPDAGKRVADQISPLVEGDDSFKTILASLPTLTEAQVSAVLDRLDAFYAQVERVWDMPDAEQQLKALNQQLADGQFGDLARLLAPALSKCHSSDVKAQAEHAAAVKQLEAFVPYR